MKESAGRPPMVKRPLASVSAVRPVPAILTKAPASGLSEVASDTSPLMKQFPEAKKVIVTLRGSINADHNTWSGVLFDGKKLFEAPEYQITHIVDRVGGGDSFMGGLIYGLLTYPGDDQVALNFAVAASCLKHTIHGDFNLVSVSEVEQLMKGDGSGRVVR